MDAAELKEWVKLNRAWRKTLTRSEKKRLAEYKYHGHYIKDIMRKRQEFMAEYLKGKE